MILGIGTDIVDIRRIEKLMGEKFVARCFTQGEQEYCNSKKNGGGDIAAYARRFAAKEACAKALGTGIGGQAGLKDIEVVHNDDGQPHIILHNSALGKFEEIGGSKVHLSLSDDPPYAMAFVVLEGF